MKTHADVQLPDLPKPMTRTLSQRAKEITANINSRIDMLDRARNEKESFPASYRTCLNDAEVFFILYIQQLTDVLFQINSEREHATSSAIAHWREVAGTYANQNSTK